MGGAGGGAQKKSKPLTLDSACAHGAQGTTWPAKGNHKAEARRGKRSPRKIDRSQEKGILEADDRKSGQVSFFV
jgi:hypothetical protein